MQQHKPRTSSTSQWNVRTYFMKLCLASFMCLVCLCPPRGGGGGQINIIGLLFLARRECRALIRSCVCRAFYFVTPVFEPGRREGLFGWLIDCQAYFIGTSTYVLLPVYRRESRSPEKLYYICIFYSNYLVHGRLISRIKCRSQS